MIEAAAFAAASWGICAGMGWAGNVGPPLAFDACADIWAGASVDVRP